jgi:diguanylate cyclase (GGDEF)-like protein
MTRSVRGSVTDDIDPLEVRFRLDSVQCGVWVSVVVCAAAAAYLGFVGNPEHETFIWIVTALGAFGSLATLRLPWEAIIRSKWREPAFLTWTLADLLMIGALAALDGGAESPFALSFFIPVVFVGLSYPMRSVVLVGIVAIGGYAGLAAASGGELGYALLFASTLLTVVIMSSWQARNHDRRREQIAHMSRTDALTGALNRRGFEDAAAGVLAGAQRFDWPVCLLLFDLNEFKGYNDTFGHAAGDALLRSFVSDMGPLLRPTDALARVGGDEFAVLLPRSSRAQGQVVARRIADTLGDAIPHCCGLSCAPDDGEDLDALYQRADEELYARKAERKARDAGALQLA